MKFVTWCTFDQGKSLQRMFNKGLNKSVQCKNYVNVYMMLRI